MRLPIYIIALRWAEPLAIAPEEESKDRFDIVTAAIQSQGGRLHYWFMTQGGQEWLSVVSAPALDRASMAEATARAGAVEVTAVAAATDADAQALLRIAADVVQGR